MLAGILVPGHGYTAQGPLLDLAGHALRDRGAHRETITWQVPASLLATDHVEAFVRAHVAAALHRTPGGRPVIIAKSLGTYAAVFAATLQLPGIYLTPVLTSAAIVDALTVNPAPALLIGGTADRLWLPGQAAATGKSAVTVPDGDHGLRVPGPLRAYTDVLGTVGTAIEEFLDAL
ncbi:alpha/beta hydrolase [Micromonosporaceae bacterium Da 78-11]